MWLLLLRWLNSVGMVGSLWLVYLVLITGVRRCIWYCFVCGVFVVLRLVASLLLGLFWWWRFRLLRLSCGCIFAWTYC